MPLIQMTPILNDFFSKLINLLLQFLRHPSLLMCSLTFDFWLGIMKNKNELYKKYYLYII